MLLVPAEVRPSPIHGLGLFALKPVPKNTPIWRFQIGFDREIFPAAWDALPTESRQFIEWFGYLDGTRNAWILSGDHACFMNHSTAPNTGMPSTRSSVRDAHTTLALRNISAGEELTCDYFAFDARAPQKLVVSQS